MPWIEDYARECEQDGVLTVIGGHYPWPGAPDRFAERSARDALALVDASQDTRRAFAFLDDIAASQACTSLGCDLSGKPVRVGAVELPGLAAWLAAEAPRLEAAALAGDDARRALADELAEVLRREGATKLAWPSPVSALLEASQSGGEAFWLGLEMLLYMTARSSFRPLLLSARLGRRAPAVLLERSMLNAASRMLHKVKKGSAPTGLEVETEGPRRRYVVRGPEGQALELRYEEGEGEDLRGANKCAAILSQLFFHCCKAAVTKTSRKLAVLYVVPCYDRARLNDGMWAFGQVYRDLGRWLGVQEVRLASAFYCTPERDVLLCDEHVFETDAPPRLRTLELQLPRTSGRRPSAAARRLVYADNNATTPMDPAVLETMLPLMTEAFGNASSAHGLGWRAEAAVARAAREVADLIGAEPDEIFFTSGATESNNWWLGHASSETLVVTSPLEHKSVLEAAHEREERGADVVFLPVDEHGAVSLVSLEEGAYPPGTMVSLMAVNNEIHTVLDLERVGRLCARHGYIFHTDAAQGLGRVALDVRRMEIAAMSLSGHKIHGPKGVGALFVSRPLQKTLRAQMLGGGQQRNKRAGTLPTPLIAGFGKACALARESFVDENERLYRMAEDLLTGLDEAGVPYAVVGPRDVRARRPGSLCLTLDGVDATRLCERIPEIAVSQGSACNSRGVGSHVLRTLGFDLARARSVVRISFGRMNDREDAARVSRALTAVATGEALASKSEELPGDAAGSGRDVPRDDARDVSREREKGTPGTTRRIPPAVSAGTANVV